MQIGLSPQCRPDRLTLERQGDTLVINGTAFEFGPLPEGAALPRAAVACDVLVSDVTRIGGEIRLTLILSHGEDAPHDTRFPAPLNLTEDGPVDLPAYVVTP